MKHSTLRHMTEGWPVFPHKASYHCFGEIVSGIGFGEDESITGSQGVYAVYDVALPDGWKDASELVEDCRADALRGTTHVASPEFVRSSPRAYAYFPFSSPPLTPFADPVAGRVLGTGYLVVALLAYALDLPWPMWLALSILTLLLLPRVHFTAHPLTREPRTSRTDRGTRGAHGLRATKNVLRRARHKATGCRREDALSLHIADPVAHWNHVFEMHMMTASQQVESANASTLLRPTMLIQVMSADRMDSQKVLGYGYLELPSRPGMYEYVVPTWKPIDGVSAKMNEFFLGSSTFLHGPAAVLVPDGTSSPRRDGMTSECLGSVRIRLSVLTQSTPPPDLSPPSSPRGAGGVLQRTNSKLGLAASLGRGGLAASMGYGSTVGRLLGATSRSGTLASTGGSRRSGLGGTGTRQSGAAAKLAAMDASQRTDYIRSLISRVKSDGPRTLADAARAAGSAGASSPSPLLTSGAPSPGLSSGALSALRQTRQQQHNHSRGHGRTLEPLGAGGSEEEEQPLMADEPTANL